MKVLDDWERRHRPRRQDHGIASNDYHLLERLETEMMTRLGTSVAAHRSQDYYLDVTHQRKPAKGHALRAIARLLDVDGRKRLRRSGTCRTTISMLTVAGLSIAMGNAPEDVQGAAMIVTGPNTHDGWADAIEAHVLPRAPGAN